MGREIRMVPPNWEHPQGKDEWRRGQLQSMFDKHYDDAVREWKEEYAKWEAGERDSYFDASDYPDGIEFWEWHGNPPDRNYYRPWRDHEATWYQLWETVSEGTPVSPPFATQEELINHLAEFGDDWGDIVMGPIGAERVKRGWGRERAERFVLGFGWAPSLVIENGKVMSGVEAMTK